MRTWHKYYLNPDNVDSGYALTADPWQSQTKIAVGMPNKGDFLNFINNVRQLLVRNWRSWLVGAEPNYPIDARIKVEFYVELDPGGPGPNPNDPPSPPTYGWVDWTTLPLDEYIEAFDVAFIRFAWDERPKN